MTVFKTHLIQYQPTWWSTLKYGFILNSNSWWRKHRLLKGFVFSYLQHTARTFVLLSYRVQLLHCFLIGRTNLLDVRQSGNEWLSWKDGSQASLIRNTRARTGSWHALKTTALPLGKFAPTVADPSVRFRAEPDRI